MDGLEPQQPDTRTLPHHPAKAKMGAPDRYSFPSDPVANPEAVVTGGSEGNYYRFTILTSRLLRYEWSPDGGFEDRVSTLAFFRNFEVPTFAVVESKRGLEITTAHFRLTYNKKEFSPQGLSVKVGNDVWRYDGQSYGDLGGTARTLDNVDGRIPVAPGVLSRKKAYAVLEDSDSMLFEKGWLAIRQPGRKDGYLFAYQGDHKAAIKDFYKLSGKQPVLPRWSLGNWWSRYHEYSDSEYITLMNNFRKAEIPLSVAVIDMDWHKVNIPEKYGSGWTGYSWNRNLFPDPESFLRELHRRGLKVTVNDHPADGIRAFEDLYPEVAKALNQDPSSGEPILFDCTNKHFLDAYFDVLKANIEKQGIDFWWIDWQQGNKSKIPGVDPLWVLNHYHYLTSKRNIGTTEEPITFSRYAGPGSHRYPIGFSGDTIITWASLQFQPEFTATASNIGYGWWSHDIGGHMGGSRSNELTARWVQLGCFSPILRLHSEKNQWNSKEPWNYEPDTASVMKQFLVLRHRLIPYLYTMNIRAHEDNEPLIQPMYWNHSSPAAYTVPNQYNFGPNLIVAPITTPHNASTLLAPVTAWLPEGRYVDLFHPTLVYDGGRHIHLHRPLSEIPVLAPQGTIVVLDGTPKLPNGVSRPTDLEIVLVVGADASFDLIEEPEPESSEYVRTPITWNQQYGRLSVGPASSGPTRWRNWRVKLVGHTGPRTGRHETHIISRDLENRCTTLDFGSQSEFTVYLGDNLQLDVVDIRTRVHEVLHRCEMGYWMKEQTWLAVTDSELPVEQRVEKLRALEIDDAVKDAVMEIWAADGRAAGSARGLERWTKEGEGEDCYVLV